MRFPKENILPEILRHIKSLQTPRRTSVLQKNWRYKTSESPITQVSKAIGTKRMRLNVNVH